MKRSTQNDNRRTNKSLSAIAALSLLAHDGAAARAHGQLFKRNRAGPESPTQRHPGEARALVWDDRRKDPFGPPAGLAELRQALAEAEERIGLEAQIVNDTRRQMRALRKYILALEKQLEPSVVAEIKDLLAAQEAEEAGEGVALQISMNSFGKVDGQRKAL